MGSKKFPQARAKVQEWLDKQYPLRGDKEHPLVLTTREASEGSGVYASTVGAVLQAMVGEGSLGMITLGTYEYDPGRTATPLGAEHRKRRLDTELTAKLIRFIRVHSGEIVTSKQIAEETGVKSGSIPGAMDRIAKRNSSMRVTKLRGGIWEIGGASRTSKAEATPAPSAEPPAVSIPAVPERNLLAVSATPEAVAAPRSAELSLNGIPEMWELEHLLSTGEVIQRADDGTIWVARRMS